MGKRQLAGTGSDHLFVVPYFAPPPQLGIQAPYWGEGGPSGDMGIKQRTIQPMANVIGFCGQPVAQSYMTLLPMGQGVPRTRPASAQVAYGRAADARPWTVIDGMRKQPGSNA